MANPESEHLSEEVASFMRKPLAELPDISPAAYRVYHESHATHLQQPAAYEAARAAAAELPKNPENVEFFRVDEPPVNIVRQIVDQGSVVDDAGRRVAAVDELILIEAAAKGSEPALEAIPARAGLQDAVASQLRKPDTQEMLVEIAHQVTAELQKDSPRVERVFRRFEQPRRRFVPRFSS